MDNAHKVGSTLAKEIGSILLKDESSAPKKVSLFPMDCKEEFTAVACEKSYLQGKNGIGKISYSAKSDTPYSYKFAVSDKFTADEPNILSNGYYFENKTYDDTIKNVTNQSKISSKNIMPPRLSNFFTNYFISVTNSLAPSLSIIAEDTSENLKFICGSDDKKQLYLFASRYRNLNPDFKNKISGKPIFSAGPNETITSIVIFKNFKNSPIAIALDSGNIIIGHLVKDKFVKDKKLESIPNKNMQLFAVNNCLLVAKSPGELFFHTWDLTRKYTAVDFPCPDAVKFKASSSGKYITALGSQENDTYKTVYVFEFNTNIEQKTIQLANPIFDFVIGNKDKVCYFNDTGIVNKDNLESFAKDCQNEMTGILDLRKKEPKKSKNILHGLFGKCMSVMKENDNKPILSMK